ncbi:20827_t:CDS:1, partial [Gigaspora margarita]
ESTKDSLYDDEFYSSDNKERNNSDSEALPSTFISNLKSVKKRKGKRPYGDFLKNINAQYSPQIIKRKKLKNLIVHLKDVIQSICGVSQQAT